VDLHLHPVWQREIMDNLSAHFPNVHFIATAHSPLMVPAAMESNYIVLKYNAEGVLVENNPERIDGWRIDQILTSEFFGLQSARGLKYEQLLDRRQALLGKKRLKVAEKKELQDIEKRLTKLPAGETPKEIENRKFISEVVEKIKKTNVRIKI
jgi:predicted ATP-binding protein involved in virulence